MRLPLVVVLLTLPWLNPFSPGPTSAVMPLLFAWSCAAGVLLAWASAYPQRPPLAWVRAIATAWLAAAGLSALMGLLQYLGASDVFWPWVNRADLGVAYGNLRQRNQYASLLNIGLAALWWWAGAGSGPAAGTQPPGWPRRLALAALALLLGLGNAASSSRTGLVELLVLLSLSLYWQWRAPGQHRSSPSARHQRQLLGIALLAYAAGLWLLPWLVGLDPAHSGALARLRAGDPACASRLTLWHNVLTLIAQKPWLGWGWGELDYAHFITLYPGGRFCDILDNAHNLPLHLAVELGVPLALAFVALVVWLIWLGRPWREQDPRRQLAWAVLAVLTLHSLLEYPLWYGPFQLAVVLCGCLLWPRSWQLRWALAPYLQASLAALVLTCCALAAWQYQLASQIYLAPAQRMASMRERPLEQARHARLFQDQLRFAELSITPLTPDNAAYLNQLGRDLLHFSPEARVAEVVIDSALLLGREEEARYYLARYQAAFPQAHARWRQSHGNF